MEALAELEAVETAGGFELGPVRTYCSSRGGGGGHGNQDPQLLRSSAL